MPPLSKVQQQVVVNYGLVHTSKSIQSTTSEGVSEPLHIHFHNFDIFLPLLKLFKLG